jgi:arabinofuranosyltransferase
VAPQLRQAQPAADRHDVRVYDPIGLASPLAAHSTRIPGERNGHDKYLGYGFELAAAGVTELPPGSPVPPAEWAAALRTAHCPDIRELLDSVREPLTAGRFWTNLAGAPRRSTMRFSNDVLRSQHCASHR